MVPRHGATLIIEMRPAVHLLALLLLGAMSFVGCGPATAPTEAPASAASTIVSLQGIDCESCGRRVVEVLSKHPGVYAVSFDRALAEVSVQYDATKTSPRDFLSVVDELGYQAVEGAGQGTYVPEVEFPPGLDVAKVSEDGEAVVLRDHLAAGKVTVFDFYAAWCKPCREVDHHMKQVLAAHADVALRKIDVVDWDSEAVTKHLSGVSDLPYVVVFGPSGKQVAAISGLRLDAIDAAIEKARTK